MANPFGNHFFVYGSQEQVDRFLAALLREDPAENLRSRGEQINIDHWGTRWIGPDVYWTSGEGYGVSMLTKGLERVFKPQEFQLDHVRRLDLNDKSKSNGGRANRNYFSRQPWASWSERPGCVPPSKEDAIAYCKFYSPWSPPFKWFGKVATDLFASGLRFVMDSIDLANVGNNGSHEVMQFWSVDGPGEFYQDGHWAMCIETVDGSDDDDDEYPYHVDESAEMVQQSEGESK